MENLSVENYFIEATANGKEPHICETYNDIEDALLRLEIQSTKTHHPCFS